MNKVKVLVYICLVIMTINSPIVARTKKNPVKLMSPDKKLELAFDFSSGGDMSFVFSVAGKQLINKSQLGLTGIDVPALIKASRRSVNTVWNPVWGKRLAVADVFNELTLDVKSYKIVARAYNDGVAFRYDLLSGIADQELTEFNFSDNYTAWFYNGENANIGPEKLSDSDGKRLPVMTVKADNRNYLAIHEADLTSGDPLVLKSRKGETLFSVASKPNTAWRVIMYGKTPGDLVDTHMLELLNPAPSKSMDFSWVKPGVSVWDWRINGAVVDDFKYEMSLPSWKRMVDFASENNIKYLVLDADWYGPEFGEDSDPIKGGKVAQVHEIIKYGKSKGVGIWLYLNDVGGRNYPLEQTLKQYSNWGAEGIKYGFMKGTPAEKNMRTRKITELCAQNRLLCDFHDGPVHPYGQMRTYPNALTREYCHSQLDAHRVFVPSTFVTSVFVNMIAGPIDMCNGMFDLRQGNTTRTDENQPVPSTLVSEAARTLIVYSGATIIPDIPEYYRKYPDLLQFIAAQKMPWRESKTLSGEIGEYIVMARQAADGVWLVGAATNESARELTIPLTFLKKGKYEVSIIQDGNNAHYLTNREVFKAESKTLQSNDFVNVRLAAGGGACLVIKTKKNTVVKTIHNVLLDSSKHIGGELGYLSSIKKELKKQWPANRTINLVFHGHSVPAGYFKTPVVNTLDSYPFQVLRELKKHYPYAVINIINTSIGGEHSAKGAERFKSEVLIHKPDVLFIDYGLNDRKIGLEKSGQAWEEMIKAALRKKIKVILLTPSPDSKVNILDKNSELEKHADQIRELSKKHGVGLVDSYELFRQEVLNGNDLAIYMAQFNHPNEKGCSVIAKGILDYFE